MSINSALIAGTSALLSNSSALAGISDNIANVNTTGYKQNRTDFESLVGPQNGAHLYAAAGVTGSTRSLVSSQGILESSTLPTDIGISGQGFFVVTQNPTDLGENVERFFTRAGAFTADAEGNLRNVAGYYLQGWPVATDGSVAANPSDPTALQTVNISSLSGLAEPTTSVNFNANLDAGQSPDATKLATYTGLTNAASMSGGGIQPDFSSTFRVYDSLGGSREFTMGFVKTATANVWNAEIYATDSSTIDSGLGVSGLVARGQVSFTSDGRLITTSPATTLPLTISINAGTSAAAGAGTVEWGNGLGVSAQSFTIDLAGTAGGGGLTQFDSPSTLSSTSSNGAPVGQPTGVEIDDSGFVIAQFSNGLTRPIFQIPVATFVNADGLYNVGGNAYRPTMASGSFALQIPGQGGAGKVSARSLESSTVDLAKEFSNLVITQRAYSASTKIITTADEMLQELISVKR